MWHFVADVAYTGGWVIGLICSEHCTASTRSGRVHSLLFPNYFRISCYIYMATQHTNTRNKHTRLKTISFSWHYTGLVYSSLSVDSPNDLKFCDWLLDSLTSITLHTRVTRPDCGQWPRRTQLILAVLGIMLPLKFITHNSTTIPPRPKVTVED